MVLKKNDTLTITYSKTKIKKTISFTIYVRINYYYVYLDIYYVLFNIIKILLVFLYHGTYSRCTNVQHFFIRVLNLRGKLGLFIRITSLFLISSSLLTCSMWTAPRITATGYFKQIRIYHLFFIRTWNKFKIIITCIIQSTNLSVRCTYA